MKQHPYLIIMFLLWLLAACNSPHLPEHYTESNVLPKIYPDYIDVTVPVNIAPLNLEVLNGADDAVVRYSAEGQEIICGGLKARPDLDAWKALTQKAKGTAINIEVFTEQGGQWMRFKPFNIYVSPDSITPWMSYRLISPSYVSYEELTLNQRCLENFDEQVFVDNMLCSTESVSPCTPGPANETMKSVFFCAPRIKAISPPSL